MTRARATVCVKKATRESTVAGVATVTMDSRYAAHASVSWVAPTRKTVTVKVDASVMSVDSAHAR